MIAPAALLRGTPASAGTASGPIFIAAEPVGARAGPRTFAEAASAVARRLESAAAEAPEAAAEILRAQALMALDPGLAAEVARRGDLEAAVEGYASGLESLADAYLRERATDVREVGRLLRLEMRGEAGSRLAALAAPSIVVAAELSPLDTLTAPRDLLLALVTETGGVTSHAAIVARELGIPAVVGVNGAVEAARPFGGAEVDGATGEVRLLEHAAVARAGTTAERLSPGGLPIRLMANAGSVPAVEAAAARGFRGVGLFRTEFMFMSAAGPMPEAEQAAVYTRICELMAPHPVVIRTLDAGADKPLPYLDQAPEANPQLGRRGVRLWLSRDSLWRPQVRALLRAAAVSPNLRVMIPMVVARAELIAVRRRFEHEARELGVQLPALGMMVEVPAAAAALHAFSGVADFISLGTNDLTQYAVAADREASWGEELSEFNPGVLALIAGVLAAARELRIPAGVCGELAGRPAGAVFLAGAGADSLSMTPDAAPQVAAALAGLGMEGLREAAGAALRATSARSARRALSRGLAQP